MSKSIFPKLSIVGVLLIGVTSLSLTNRAFAAVGGGGTGGTASGGSGGTGSSIGRNVGGGWFHFEWGVSGSQSATLGPSNYWPNNIITWKDGGIEYVGDNSGFPPGTVGAECAAIGGYYVSSWYHFLRGQTYVGLVGIAQNSIWNEYATLYDSTAGGTQYGNPKAPIQPVNMTEVKAHFDLAKSLGIIPGDTNWDNVGWFCYDDSLQEKKGEVHAKSTITAKTDGVTYSEESDVDGFVGIKISTDSGEIDVSFGQEFTFTNEEGSDFTIDNPSKTFQEKYDYIGTKKNGKEAVNEKRQWDTTVNNNSLTYSPTEDKNTIKVTLNEGEVTAPICRKAASYNTKLSFSGASDVEYSAPTASTEACIIIERPKTPGPSNEELKPSVAGENSTNPMYIGEGSSVGWNTKVDNQAKKLKHNATGTLTVKTRRLKRYKVISYLVDPALLRTVEDVSESVAGSNNYSSNNNLCNHIKNELGSDNIRSCGVVYGRDGDPTKEREKIWDTATTDGFTYSKRQGVVVPETYGSNSSIGAKYCTTMGYKFQYWYGVNKTGGANWSNNLTWTEDSNRDAYWYIFPSACSVIAKRPEVAVWNGSVFAPGGVNTALSQRYADTTMGKLTSDTSKNRVFGSWDEYLVIANGSIKGMASASAIANGKTSDKSEQLSVAYNEKGESNSRMTIQNLVKSTGLGYAEISASESYADNMSNLATGADRHEGDFTIENDIISSGSFAVNNLPQRIIYVNGDLKIKSNVKRIDAWLLVTGEIDTCSDVADKDLNSTNCNQPLQFNGPVMAKNIKLRRTNGAENNDAATPAEVFNLRPDAYIWAYHKSIDPGDTGYDYKVVNSRELAPRF